MERTVQVWGKPYTVSVHQKSKSVWVATGTFMEETHSTTDRSANSAIKRWREWAEYKGS